MNGGKRFVITLVAGLCVAGIIAGISRLHLQASLPEHTPGNVTVQEHAEEPEPTAEAEVKEVQIGEEVFLSAVTETLDGQLDTTELAAEIGENTNVTLTGAVSKEDVTKLLESQADGISSAYQAVLELLPEDLPLTLEIGLQTSDGTVQVIPKSFQVASMEIPETFIEENLFDRLEQNINREISKQVSQVQSITSKDGGLLLTGI
ncbi:MAG: hypothetical protein Q4P20_05785 [Eubacteriales bacterium]|nr:hypothetical protein [Eubacteriales bacterium]